jgi:hypothetical protein
MSEDTWGTLTAGLWVLSALVLGALFISAGAQGELTPGHLLMAFVLLTLAVVGTVFLWRQKDTDPSQQKAKRGRINTLLRDLSDEEILELKHRLPLADFSDQTPLSALDEDGELVLRS